MSNIDRQVKDDLEASVLTRIAWIKDNYPYNKEEIARLNALVWVVEDL